MKHRTPAQNLRATLLTAAVALVLEIVLRHAFAARDTVAVLLASGGNAPRLEVALALVFVGVRCFTHLLLPGLLARDAVLAWLHRCPRRRLTGVGRGDCWTGGLVH